MNINLNAFCAPRENLATVAPGLEVDILSDEIAEHQEIITKAVGPLTGKVALISDPDPSLAQAGAMQVWSETEAGYWVRINEEGEEVMAECPFE